MKLETMFDYVQLHGFPFNDKVKGIWKASDFLEIIFAFFEIFDMNKYLPRINYTTFMLSIYFLNFLVLLVILDIIYVSYSFK